MMRNDERTKGELRTNLIESNFWSQRGEYILNEMIS